jgi:aminoglycoside/choline kinase family phosphotransferase
MDVSKIISEGYEELFGKRSFEVIPLPKSGSDRKYFRIHDGQKSVIGAYNANPEENEAFVGFSVHFISKGLPVPEIFGFLPDKNVYYLRDLGDTNLFTWLQNRNETGGFDDTAEKIYSRVLEQLIRFQTDGIKGLNLDLCYPHRSFDKQSMMWDMNYFKYMFLKLLAVPFNERRLEHDFEKLADFLLGTGQDYFLYRDFQSANVMLVDGDPWFIDYQGGRRGAPQYDVASLLYDAKAHVPEHRRQRLLNDYIAAFCSVSGEKRDEFTGYFTGFSMIRLMQAMGAFGFRGLYEKKPTFVGSIVPAVALILQIADSGKLPVELAELFRTVRAIPYTKIYTDLKEGKMVE